MSDQENNDSDDIVLLRRRLGCLGRFAVSVCDFMSKRQSEEEQEEQKQQVEALRQLAAAAATVDADNSMEIRPQDALLALQQNAQLKVRAELEVERRQRLQTALEDAERRSFAASRLLEKRDADNSQLREDLERMSSRCDERISHLEAENGRLESLLRQKESQLCTAESVAAALTAKAEQFEDLFNGQLEAVKGLQQDLATAGEENRALVREMEMVNQMFCELERTHVDDALKNYDEDKSVEGLGIPADVLNGPNSIGKDITDNCFKEVTTKNGTRMVLSVSKTFLRLRDLIVEKRTLEDQVAKINALNTQLAQQVNTHEAKLFNVTDELNKTWDYVSSIKLQHRRLHTSEQILRAELCEKRQLLARLRQELEFGRQSWTLVKQKTADSEREWRALRDEFRERRKQEQKEEVSSSESGFEEEETPTNDAARDNLTQLTAKEPDNREEAGDDVANKRISVVVPPLAFLGEVPYHFLPPLLSPKDRPDEEDLYSRLLASTERSVEIASRLAATRADEAVISTEDEEDDDEGEEDDDDIEPRTEDDEYDGPGPESPDIVSEQMTEEGVRPEEESADQEDDLGSDTASQADSNFSLEVPFPEGFVVPTVSSESESTADSTSVLSAPVSPDPALWDYDQDEEDEQDQNLPHIPTPPPPPSFSLMPPVPTMSVRPTYNYANVHSNDNSDDDDDGDQEGSNEESMENATAVTRFLIKHLPKQMSKLRNDKAELEEKIQDLETRISQQSVDMEELERRADMHKKSAERAKKELKENVDKILPGRISSCLSENHSFLVIPFKAGEGQPRTMVQWKFLNVPKDVDASVTMQSTIEASEEDVIISKRPVSENEMIQFASSHDGKIYKLNLYTGLTPSRERMTYEIHLEDQGTAEEDRLIT